MVAALALAPLLTFILTLPTVILIVTLGMLAARTLPLTLN